MHRLVSVTVEYDVRLWPVWGLQETVKVDGLGFYATLLHRYL